MAKLDSAGSGGRTRVRWGGRSTAAPHVARRAPYFPDPLGTRTACIPETRKDGGGVSYSAAGQSGSYGLTSRQHHPPTLDPSVRFQGTCPHACVYLESKEWVSPKSLTALAWGPREIPIPRELFQHGGGAHFWGHTDWVEISASPPVNPVTSLP